MCIWLPSRTQAHQLLLRIEKRVTNLCIVIQVFMTSKMHICYVKIDFEISFTSQKVTDHKTFNGSSIVLENFPKY